MYRNIACIKVFHVQELNIEFTIILTFVPLKKLLYGLDR